MRQKITFIPILLFFISAGFVSCEDNGSSIGENWMQGSTRMMIIDTCTIKLSTMQLDSISTSGGTQLFVGTFNSDIYGKSSLSSYLTFNTTKDFTYVPDPERRPRLRFDSLTLMLQMTPMYCGDTTQQATLNVHRLTQRVELNEKTGKIYSHNQFTYQPDPVASISFYPRPVSRRNVEIRLPDELGHDFFNKLQDRDDEIKTDNDFQRYFNGLVLVPADNSVAQLSFGGTQADTICWMRLYYREMDAEIDHEVDFYMARNKLFHHADIDRTGTVFENLSRRNYEISSAETDGKVVALGMGGTYAKIEFPHLNNLREIGDHGHVVAAKLLIHPLKGTFARKTYAPLPDSMMMYTSTEHNVTMNAITYNNSDTQYGSLSYNEEFQENTYYSYDITSFITNQIGKIGIEKQHLQLISGDYGYNMTNLVIGNQNSEIENIKLEITYSVYNE